MDLAEDEVRPVAGEFTVMDLFAGCGGFSEGFSSFADDLVSERPRFRTVAAVENDPAAAATYAANHESASVFQGLIEDFDPRPYAESIDVIAGGPPCQGFSNLGKGYADDPRNELWRHYLRVVDVVRPRVFVLENVDRFAASPDYARLAEQVRSDGLGEYHLEAAILNAADYGVPQARRRTIVIGSHRDLGEPAPFPVPTHTKEPMAVDDMVLFSEEDQLLRWVPVETVFEQSSRVPILGTELPQVEYHGEVPGPYFTPELHFGRNPTPLSVARYKAIPQGGNRHDLRDKFSDDGEYLSTPAWDSHLSGTNDVMGRLRAGQPSVTIRTEFFKPEKGRYLHPTEHRPITHYEAALIQGFPDEYQWYGSKSDIARQIGNAVPIGLARALATAIYNRLASMTYEKAA
ncbi:DNA cytosine methyltransferase [Streptomyces marispadix]|uniref:Cytosine-specific methyltransferase n=1 Tax=Streptomyces marispadix TaxID=2922868 RepID=A0ABS9SX11_9ACTN|nr:DNA cytosine methyltransferase [Streptomyces marispadix]MCH6160817.1 DNA cytosine methyltransferase [Streptomyces marispadix]